MTFAWGKDGNGIRGPRMAAQKAEMNVVFDDCQWVQAMCHAAGTGELPGKERLLRR
jgi:hypothetical protein